jgi:hypothetical protein
MRFMNITLAKDSAKIKITASYMLDLSNYWYVFVYKSKSYYKLCVKFRKNNTQQGLIFWRRDRDSNPGYRLTGITR